MRHSRRVLEFLTSVTGAIAGLLVVLMMLHITADVIGRSIFNRPLTGTVTYVANFYMVFVVCLPLALVERLDQHISVDIVTNGFSAPVQFHLYSWTYLLSAVVFALVTWTSWAEAINKYGSGSFLIEQNARILIWPGYFAVPIGYGLGAAYFIFKFLIYIISPRYVPEKAEELMHKGDNIHE